MTPEAKRRALGLLRMEIDSIRKRGFGGLLCIGTGKSPSFGCCEACPLLDLTPPEYRSAESPCRHIPLNKQREIMETMAKKRAQVYLEEQLLIWMEQTALRLENELWYESDPRHKPGMRFPE